MGKHNNFLVKLNMLQLIGLSILILVLQGSDRSLMDQYVEKTDELLNRANKNNLSKALLYMQKALLLAGDAGRVSKEQKKLLEVGSGFTSYLYRIVVKEVSKN